jgi:hypothetical protein
MKKLTTIITGLLLLFSTTAFTVTEGEVTTKIKTVFEKEFVSASEVTWTRKDEVYVASFKEKDNYLSAAYNLDGELLNVARFIPLEQLPLNVTRALENRFAGYDIDPKAIELSTDITSYIIYAENAKFKLKIKSDASGYLSIESKKRKK